MKQRSQNLFIFNFMLWILPVWKLQELRAAAHQLRQDKHQDLRQKRPKLTSASWLRPECGGFHNRIRFNCAPFFASCRRHRVLTFASVGPTLKGWETTISLCSYFYVLFIASALAFNENFAIISWACRIRNLFWWDNLGLVSYWLVICRNNSLFLISCHVIVWL
jgi:hypothetical protein